MRFFVLKLSLVGGLVPKSRSGLVRRAAGGRRMQKGEGGWYGLVMGLIVVDLVLEVSDVLFKMSQSRFIVFLLLLLLLGHH